MSQPKEPELFRAQKGKCFHCAEVMDESAWTHEHPNGWGWTRDHLFPRAYWKGMHNNVVLAHRECNRDKGARLPTKAEVARARALYAGMGLVAFIPGGNISKRAQQKLAASELAGIVFPTREQADVAWIWLTP